MRTLVEPAPTTRCKRCGGELRIKQVISGSINLDLDQEIFVCAACGREQAYTVPHDRNGPHLKAGLVRDCVLRAPMVRPR